ncbi:hypothetical protein HDU76_001031 [Blyttiomyces sp. JEL0837]|nr:hypothetical protein HDU76_001031 [Blyttiomyces sp. JEL0837]
MMATATTTHGVIALATLASLVMAASPASSLTGTTSNYCSPKGTIQDTCCEYQSVDQVNANISPILDNLLGTSFFRYYKVDLNKGCSFWKEADLCSQVDCTVAPADESEIPEDWKSASLSSVDFSSIDSGLGLLKKKCDFSEKDFCVVEDEASSDGVYVNLLKNPERFTGYAGDSAARVWKAIYTENCFKIDDDKGLLDDVMNVAEEAEGGTGTCTEKRVFYRLISGLHASISTHICYNYFDQRFGIWEKNPECFRYRVGNFPDRIENMYFAYVVYLRAVAKLSPYLGSYTWCTGFMEDRDEIQSLMLGLVQTTMSCPSTFDEKLLFADSTSKQLKDEFKNHFRNISQIMDCVGCEKCRLWGKLQTTGLGTALKILFSFNDNPKTYRLTRGELVALMNGFGRLSESISALNYFRSLNDESVKKVAAESPVVNVVPQASTSASASESESTKLSNFAAAGLPLNLAFTDFWEPKQMGTWVIGFVLAVVGMFRFLLKGYQLEMGTMKVPDVDDRQEDGDGDSDGKAGENGNNEGSVEDWIITDSPERPNANDQDDDGEEEGKLKTQNYIAEGVENNIRSDGRGRSDYRKVIIETGIISQASGSCRVKIEGGSDVLVGVKAQIGSIESERNDPNEEPADGEVDVAEGLPQDRGRVTCAVECSSSALRHLDHKDVEQMTYEYGEMMMRILNGDHGGLDLKALCIVPGATCWVVYVDALILDYGGNLLDAIFAATRGALQNSLLPKFSIEESGGIYEFEIADEETEEITGSSEVPIVVTLHKIGHRYVVDPTPLEELCSDARVTVAVNRKGNICALQKGGQGGIEPSLLQEMIQSAKTIAMQTMKNMDTALSAEKERIRTKQPAVGFTAPV